jgi:hypothetical protein
MATSAPICRSVATAMPMLSGRDVVNREGCKTPHLRRAAAAREKIIRMVPSNLMMELGHSAVP